jgi:hypothetical protein
MWVVKCGYAAAYGHSFWVLYCAERHVDIKLVFSRPIFKNTQISSSIKIIPCGRKEERKFKQREKNGEASGRFSQFC